MSSAFDQYRDWRESIPYSLNSTMRFSYQFPKQPADILKSNTTRFGCNSKKHIPASGIGKSYNSSAIFHSDVFAIAALSKFV